MSEYILAINYFFQPCLRRALAWVIQENCFKKRMTFFLLSKRSALECVILGKFLGVHDFSTKSEKCVGVRDLGEILEVMGVRWECMISSTNFKKMLEVLGVPRKCVAHFCYSGGSAFGMRESALEWVTYDRSAWKVRTPMHFCLARAAKSRLNPFYTPIFRWDVLWYGAVRPSVCPFVRPSDC